MEKRAIIIGAGPAGLTAAYELLKRTDIKPVILEKSGDIGGISKTVNYKGNRIDIGGHRFFSKSDRVMNWWMNIMPVEESQKKAFNITYQNKSRKVDLSNEANNGAAIADPDKVMLVRPRLSRIYFLRKFFTYPIQLSIDTLRKLGLSTTISIMFSYLKAQLSPRRPEKNLEDFMINRFGQVLYKLFFKDYTQKVWGVPCQDIPAEWGAQRIKGVSIAKAIQHAIQSATKRNATGDISQKATETSLIEQFLYPKYGPGQLWEEVARQVESMGGIIHMNHVVEHVYNSADSTRVTAIAAVNTLTGESLYLEGDYFFSTMPVKELIAAVDGAVPENVKEIAAGLQYRDFITVGILLKQLSSQDKATGEWQPRELKDTWIYIQEKEVTVGRLQIFNNWSPYMVNILGTVWVGMEFFCNATDTFWNMDDQDIKVLAIHELEKIGLANPANVMDATVLRMEKTYPAYFGAYERFNEIRAYTDSLENLFLVGRNGMHKYNNSDHSMLTSMVGVDNIVAGVTDKANIWAVNTEQQYHEEKVEAPITDKVLEGITESGSFRNYILNKNLLPLMLMGICWIVQFIVFKTLFPYVNYMPDSYYYLEGAYANYSINIWPIGYSKFLRVFSSFFQSDIALALVQYVMLFTAITYLVYTLFYFLRPNKVVRWIILVFFSINPIFLLISNYVAADTLFNALTLVWIAELIWITFDYRSVHLWVQAILLVLLLTIRYNALYFPMISALVILITRLEWMVKAKGILLGMLLIGVFVWHNGNKYEQITGTRQFSGFGGWQLATNALIMYSRMDPLQVDEVPTKYQQLHNIVLKHRDSLNSLKVRPDSVPGIYYLWDEHAPLRQFLDMRYRKDTSTAYFKKWATLAPFYGEYGKYLIMQHPVEFIKLYMLQNSSAFFAPPAEFLYVYNMKSDSVGDLAKTWFGYKSLRVKSASKIIKVANAYPSVVALCNGLYILGFVGFISFGGFKRATKKLMRIVSITSVLWLCNFGFSVLAAPVVLRYQLLSILLFFSVGVVLFNYVLQVDNNRHDKTII
ncbi:NAD(P)/FAD-dependent oxidoreductase [Chitinophaga sp. GbtcB8]|uniref:NAD(P)/FAD-dependent oxidoreductase n=1 Tax=Chitinophaga sp. GbtcB8 TaxID=2824753 RepID=UPI001C3080E6|nr:NAD(P)/FAD-dependent oxidoreductase [Chitinophaga sp. GbtcB8]